MARFPGIGKCDGTLDRHRVALKGCLEERYTYLLAHGNYAHQARAPELLYTANPTRTNASRSSAAKGATQR